MNLPTVTIGVTAYNAEHTIRNALQSALEQTLKAHQIIVVDDCSTDSTMAILQEFVDSHGVEVHQNSENSGVAVSRNEIVNRATGEFIVFFDDDDISAPSRVEAQIARITTYEEEYAGDALVVCHTARLQHYPDGSQRIEPTMGQREGRPPPSGPAVARRALIGEPLEDAYGSCATCSQAARTETYREIGGFDNRLKRCEDSDIAIRLALAGGHFVGIAEPLVTQHMTATSEKGLEILEQFNMLLLEKHRSVFDNERQYRFCRDWLALKFNWLAGSRQSFALGLARLSLRNPVFTLKRIRMALPNWSHNRVFGRFSREIS